MSSPNSNKMIFVTGASGFIGYTVVTHLLNEGYFVRAAARGVKADRLEDALSKTFQKNFEVVKIPNVFSDDLSVYLKGVYGIMHIAAPTPGEGSPEENLKISTSGILHILNEAVKANVSRIVTTSSTVTYPNGGPYTSTDWYPKEMSETTNYFEVYQAAKTAADKTMVEFAKAHPSLDISLVGPNYTFGPVAPGFALTLPEPDYGAISTSGYLYRLLVPNNNVWVASPGYIDVRDVAKAHLLALEAAPSAEVGLKRFPLDSPHASGAKAAIRILHEKRPALRARLAKEENAPVQGATSVPASVREDIAKKIEFGVNDYIPFEDTVLDTIDSLIRLEEYWKAKGFAIEVPTGKVL